MADESTRVGKAVPSERAESPVSKRYRLSFGQNRSFELHVGGTVYRFMPHGFQVVPGAVRWHSDFAGTDVEQFFNIQEVE